MKKAAFAPLCTLALAVLTTACGGGGSSHKDTPAEPTKGFVYALSQQNGAPNQIHGYSLDFASGDLTALPSMPINTGGTGSTLMAPGMLAYDAAHQRLFALNDGSDTIAVFNVDRSSGTLSPSSIGPISIEAGSWMSLAVHPSGSPLVAGSATELRSYRIDSTSATPVTGNPHAVSGGAFACSFSPDGAFLFAGGNSGACINGFAVNAATGALSALPGSPFDTARSATSYAVDRTGRLFHASYQDQSVHVSTLSGGVPTPVFGAPSGLDSAVHGLLHPAGYYLLADRGNNQIGVYRISGSGSATTLAPISASPIPTGGTSIQIMTLSPDGKLLVAANGGSRNLTVFSIDSTKDQVMRLSVQPANQLSADGRITGLVCVPAR